MTKQRHTTNPYDVYIPKRPEYCYEVLGKKTLLGKLGLAMDGQGWNVVGIRKVKR